MAAEAGTVFHLSSKGFRGHDQKKIAAWLLQVLGPPAPKVEGQKAWNYAFVTVEPESRDKFVQAMQGAKYAGSDVVASSRDDARAESGKRSAPADAEESSSKKAKTAASEAVRVPTLKDLRDKARMRSNKQGFDGSAQEKSAPLMAWDYGTQLGMKATFVKSAVRSYSKLAAKRSEELGREPPAWCGRDWSLAAKAPNGCCCPLDPPVGAPEESLLGWRNKCEFTIGHNAAGQIDIGFILRIDSAGSPVIAGVEDVPLVPAAMKKVCGAMTGCVAASSFPVFDRRAGVKAGVWRTLLVRHNPSGEMMVMVQTATLEGEKKEQFCSELTKALMEVDLGVVSLYLQFNDEVTDAARPNAPVALVAGKPRIEMPLLGLRLEIGPLSFFNPNTATCRFLMEKTIEYLLPQRTQVVLDIFCGVGTIGLCAAGRCDRVIGVDIAEENIENAKENAALNKIENCTFITGKAEDMVAKVLGDLAPDAEVCAVVDPSRAGLHPRLVNILRERTQVVRIVYVSCNAESLAEDVAKLGVSNDEEEDEFVPTRVVAVDSFPQTLHVEVIQLLERRTRARDPREKRDGQTTG